MGLQWHHAKITRVCSVCRQERQPYYVSAISRCSSEKRVRCTMDDGGRKTPPGSMVLPTFDRHVEYASCFISGLVNGGVGDLVSLAQTESSSTAIPDDPRGPGVVRGPRGLPSRRAETTPLVR